MFLYGSYGLSCVALACCVMTARSSVVSGQCLTHLLHVFVAVLSVLDAYFLPGIGRMGPHTCCHSESDGLLGSCNSNALVFLTGSAYGRGLTFGASKMPGVVGVVSEGATLVEGIDGGAALFSKLMEKLSWRMPGPWPGRSCSGGNTPGWDRPAAEARHANQLSQTSSWGSRGPCGADCPHRHGNLLKRLCIQEEFGAQPLVCRCAVPSLADLAVGAAPSQRRASHAPLSRPFPFPSPVDDSDEHQQKQAHNRRHSRRSPYEQGDLNKRRPTHHRKRIIGRELKRGRPGKGDHPRATWAERERVSVRFVIHDLAPPYSFRNRERGDPPPTTDLHARLPQYGRTRHPRALPRPDLRHAHSMTSCTDTALWGEAMPPPHEVVTRHGPVLQSGL